MSTHANGTIVQSTVDAQGLSKGAFYRVVSSETRRNVTGGYTSYRVEPVAADVERPTEPIGNGHLVLRACAVRPARGSQLRAGMIYRRVLFEERSQWRVCTKIRPARAIGYLVVFLDDGTDATLTTTDTIEVVHP